MLYLFMLGKSRALNYRRRRSIVPMTALTEADLADGAIDLMTLLVKTGLCTSRGDARRNVQQGGVSVNGEKVEDEKAAYAKEAFAEDFILRKGKKKYCRVVL